MTLNQLRAFIAAASLGSFTRAARFIGTSQPTVSELIRKLEQHFGLELFVRGGRSLQLTPAGHELLPWARRSVENADTGQSVLEAFHGLEAGEASIGVLRNAPYYFLTELIDKFHQSHPAIRLRLVGQNSAEVAQGVQDGSLEAGIVVLPINDRNLEVTPIFRDEVLWVGLAGEVPQKPITIEDVASRALIVYDAHYGWNDPTRRQLAERAQDHGLQLRPIVEVETVGPALDLAARGVGETFVSNTIAARRSFPEQLTTVSFDPPLYDTIALVQRVGQALSPATEELIQGAVDLMNSTSGNGRRGSKE